MWVKKDIRSGTSFNKHFRYILNFVYKCKIHFILKYFYDVQKSHLKTDHTKTTFRQKSDFFILFVLRPTTISHDPCSNVCVCECVRVRVCVCVRVCGCESVEWGMTEVCISGHGRQIYGICFQNRLFQPKISHKNMPRQKWKMTIKDFKGKKQNLSYFDPKTILWLW